MLLRGECRDRSPSLGCQVEFFISDARVKVYAAEGFLMMEFDGRRVALQPSLSVLRYRLDPAALRLFFGETLHPANIISTLLLQRKPVEGSKELLRRSLRKTTARWRNPCAHNAYFQRCQNYHY